MSQRPSGCLSPPTAGPLQPRRLRDPRALLLLGEWSIYIYVCVIILIYSILLLKPCLTLHYSLLRGRRRRNATDGLFASARLLQLRIHPAQAHELLVCPFLHDAAVADDRNRVRALDGAETVGNH